MAATLIPPAPAQEATETADVLEVHVQRVLRSPHFARADTQRRLLEYLWQHRNENLSEYALAVEALGRSRSFNSSVDASVRVHISRLRRKLKDYYEQEAGEPEMLVIPTGTHQLLVIGHLANPSVAVEVPATIGVPAIDYRRRMSIAAAVAVFFAISTGALGVAWMLSYRGTAASPKPTRFWDSFLQGNAPIRIILPTPVFFQFSNNHNFRLRSTNVNDFNDIRTDPAFAALTSKLGTPNLDQSYTVTWDTLAAIDMARYLDTVGNNSQRISFGVTRDSDMTVLEKANVIAVGTHQTLQPLHEYLQAMNFSLTHDETAVINAHPLSGEQERYSVATESPERIVRPSIIALLPGRGPGLKVLLLQSRETAAMVSLLSSDAGSNSVEEILRKHGNPKFYEIVVETELENNQPLRSWPVAVHAFRAGAPASAM
jgi:Transcriptional regulatory protein, C terminal